MRKDKAGNKLYRKMTVKVIFPDRIFPDRVYHQHAGPRQGFGPDGVDQMLEQIADQLDALYPWWQFRLTELRPEGNTIRFAFIFAGNNPTYVAPAPTIQPIADSSALGTEPPISTLTAEEIIKTTVGTTLQDLAASATGSEV
jgi:hypothetical protein